MKVAVAGKGGSGKTTVSGTLARVFADDYDVLAVDDDDDPNLAVSLGVPDEADVPPLSDELYTQNEKIEDGTSYELTKSPREIIDEYSIATVDGVTFMESCEVVADGGSPAGHVVVSLALSNYQERPGEVVVLDMAAHVDYLGVANDVDALVLVGQPYYSSLETIRKMYVVARGVGIPDSGIHIVANNVRNDHDLNVFEEYCSDRSLDISAVIPHDDALRRAEQDALAPIDYDDDSPAVRAIRELADDLVATHGHRPAQQDPTD